MRTLIDTDIASWLRSGACEHDDTRLDLSLYIQPASIDLPIGDTAYLVSHTCMPFETTVRDHVEAHTVSQLDLRSGAILYKGQTYLIPCMDISLDESLMGKISPKSSIGRIDVHTRAVMDHTGLYDVILQGHSGQLRLEVTPQSFNILIRSGIALSQLRLFDCTKPSVPLPDDEPILFVDDKPITPVSCEGDIVVTLGLDPSTPTIPVGYVARTTNAILDLTRINHYLPHDFFAPVVHDPALPPRQLILEKDKFYILATREAIRIPPSYSMEVIPFSHHMGELRAHYAGFFDPGFGGETGNTGVLEVRPLADTVVADGQPLCMIRFYANTATPSQIYGHRNNTYHTQHGPRLAKFFASSH